MTRTLCTFVPGIKGTELWCDACKRKTWPPAFLQNGVEFLTRVVRNGFSTRIENLMNRDEYECLKNHDQTPMRVIGRVNAIWGAYTRDVYGPFLNRLKREFVDSHEKNITIDTMTFPYDWTRSNVESAHRLYYILTEAAETYDNVILIGHSMGGLVCRYMLENVLTDVQCLDDGREMRRRLSGKIKLFYGVGVPHYGCVKALHHLVDPDNAEFSSFCRRVDSLYEMIPFSDLVEQVEGFDKLFETRSRQDETRDGRTATNERRRSNIFMSIGEHVVVDPRNWRLTSTTDRPEDKTGLADDSVQKQYLIDAMASRFPSLNGHLNKVHDGFNFHFSLNTDRKPPCCAYVLINATGVFSPSKIDMQGRLERRCLKGDGTVCSIVNKHKRRYNKRTAPTDENNYTDNVHVSMMNDVDFIAPIRNLARSNDNWNARHIVWNHFRCGKRVTGNRRNATRLWMTISDTVIGCVYKTPPRNTEQSHCLNTDDTIFVESQHTISVGVYGVNLYNLSSGHCIASLVVANTESNVGSPTDGCNKTLVLTVERIDKEQKRRLRTKTSCKNITFCTRDYGVSWNRLWFIMSGRFRPVSFRIDETVGSTLLNAN